MRLSLLIFIGISIFLVGCSAKTKIVYIPQKCQTLFPEPLQPSTNEVQNVKNLIKRLELLECKLHYCRGDVISKCQEVNNAK